jgi:hypothetical protein
MSISSLAKFSNVLGSVSSRERDKLAGATQAAESSSGPTDVILSVVRRGKGMIPVSDLPEQTKLENAVILDAVERLRAAEQVEIIEVPEAGGRKFIRLTPRGYAEISTP